MWFHWIRNALQRWDTLPVPLQCYQASASISLTPWKGNQDRVSHVAVFRLPACRTKTFLSPLDWRSPQLSSVTDCWCDSAPFVEMTVGALGVVSVPVWGISYVGGSLDNGAAGAPGTDLRDVFKILQCVLSTAEEVVHLYLKYETFTYIFLLACLTVVNSIVNSHMLNGFFCRK